MGKAQGDGRNEPIDPQQSERFQIWEQGSVEGPKRHDRIDFPTLLGGPVVELSHSSSVLPDTSQLRRRRESFERLSSRIIEDGDGRKMHAGALTYFALQTPSGKQSSIGYNETCVAHNTSNTGSSKLLQQHARLTAVAFHGNTVSSRATNLTISATLRHVCIKSRGGV